MNRKQRYELKQQLIDLCKIQDDIFHLEESQAPTLKINAEHQRKRMAIANILVFVDTLDGPNVVTSNISTEVVEQGATVIGVKLDRL